MKRRLFGVGVLLGCLAATPSWAQQFLGRVGAQCASPVATVGFPIALTTTVPGGTTLIVSVGLSSNFVSGVRVTDAIGTRYQALTGAENAGVGSLVYFRASLQRGLLAGQNLQLSLDSLGSDVSACASILAYSGVAFGPVVQETFGAATGVSNQVAISTNGSGTNTRKLVFGAFVSSTNPGVITPSVPASVEPTQCTGSQPFCLVDAWYFDDPASAPTISLGLANTVAWIGALTSLQADGIFGNGFD